MTSFFSSRLAVTQRKHSCSGTYWNMETGRWGGYVGIPVPPGCDACSGTWNGNWVWGGGGSMWVYRYLEGHGDLASE